MPHPIIHLDSAPGINENQLHPATGLRIGHYETQLTSDGNVIISAQPIGGVASAAVTTFTEITIDEQNRVPFPSTLCAHIIQATELVGTVRFRITGYDQYGLFQVETTPTAALLDRTNNFVYLAKVFSLVTKVEFQSAVLDIAGDTINLGTRYDWTRTNDGTNEHVAGLNLGVALFRWSGSHAQGTANPARHKLQNYEPFSGFEVSAIMLGNKTTAAGARSMFDFAVGRVDAGDWEGAVDKWAVVTLPVGITWAVGDTVQASLSQNSRIAGFNR